MRLARGWNVVVILAAIACVGCTKQAALQTEQVEGVVTLDGQAVAGATVTFVPVTEGQGQSATGQTDAAGKFTLTAVGTGAATARSGAGTLPGEYYVGVQKSEVEVPLSEEEAEKQGVRLQETSGPASPSPPPKVKHLVPPKYNTPKTSGIKVSVKQGKNVIPIELRSK